jgi:hypothetical protein
MTRRGVLVLLGLVVAATAVVAVADDGGQACPAANRKVEKIDNGVRCTVTVAEGGDVAALRAHVKGCKCEGWPEGATVSYQDVDGGVVVTRTSTDPEVVKKLQAKAEGCAAGAGTGKGCCKGHGEGHGEGAADCPHHQKQTGTQTQGKGCPMHQEQAAKAAGDKT